MYVSLLGALKIRKHTEVKYLVQCNVLQNLSENIFQQLRGPILAFFMITYSLFT